MSYHLLREWAIEVIDRYSDVELTKPVKIALQDSQLPVPSINQEKVMPICYFVEIFLTNEMNPMMSKESFEEIRVKNNVRAISKSESGKLISLVYGDIYGYASPYDLNKNDFIISAEPTLCKFQEVHRVNGELFLVGRGLVEKWDDIVNVKFGVATQMNSIIEMPFGLMARIKGQVYSLKLKDAYALFVQEIRGVIQ